jgi:hypothetical protein
MSNKITKSQFKEFVQQFKFKELFNHLGWDLDNYSQSIEIDKVNYSLTSVAQKNLFKIFICKSENKNIPNYAQRVKIEKQITKSFREHLIIFIDDTKKEQIWQYVVREIGKPNRPKQIQYKNDKEPELLYQRASGLFFELDEEENITIIDVTQRVGQNFQQNNEKVTKKFYEIFKKEHQSFIKFITGIEDQRNIEWYASLMLNRLMFCYFIQKKEFLNGDKNYLRTKLNEFNNASSNKSTNTNDNFYSFYRQFLLVLFHDGLGNEAHSDELKKKIGKIPYLNGGLFDRHEIEVNNPNINIDNSAFEKLFNFFDKYEWHLDTRPSANEKEINPDVIGYIFEKYINDRANMGAYYTKEDITDYISKNSIIPYLVEDVERNYRNIFDNDNEIYQNFIKSNDKYIYDAIKKGVELELPENINIGIDTTQPNLLERRKDWNKSAPNEYALPTEIWREVVDRRNRYNENRAKISNGEINSINDFITYNLNIRQFIQDTIDETNDPKYIETLYQSLNKVTILDPTCGSGAFLFAALNILEPLYESCIQRMVAFITDEDRWNLNNTNDFKNQYTNFRKIITEIRNPNHPNMQYFIYKSIILQNLYGVDIMKEAVEIAKLRLFLKLVASVDVDNKKPNMGLEPLPDIDFNIRAGNTLVGFATENELNNALTKKLDFNQDGDRLKDKCRIVATHYKNFKELQINNEDKERFREYKNSLNEHLNKLNTELNQVLYNNNSKQSYAEWLESHQPFHWFAEFYEIINDRGGFDVIIGNPPYVVYTEINFSYKLKDYETLKCANLYAYCVERTFNVLNTLGRFGMILPNSSISAEKLSPLQKIFVKDKTTWISNYSWRPAKLFEGANMLLAIILSVKDIEKVIRSSVYYKWYNNYREVLFETISYNNVNKIIQKGTIPKIPSNKYYFIIDKLNKKSGNKKLIDLFSKHTTKHNFFYFRAVLYWVKILEKEPIYLEDGNQITTSEMKSVYLENEELKFTLISLISSSLFFIHYITWSSCQVINNRDFELPFDITKLTKDLKLELVNLGKQIQKDYQINSKLQDRNYSTKGRSFKMEKQYFYIKKSKHIIDEIDKVLGEHYGFTEEELDFIINYDIKYRMGSELETEEEE